MINVFTSPIFHIFITIALYSIFNKIYIKTKLTVLHPLILTSIVIILYIYLINYINKTDKISILTTYNNSLNIVNLMLGPLTVALAIPIFKNWLILKKYWIPIFVSTIVGSIISISSIYLLGMLFDLDYTLIISLLPKSVTTVIAKEISINLKAIPEITVAAVIFTGILGAILGPLLSEIFKFNDPICKGVSFGVTSHAVGTAKAMEISLEVGAISSISIVTTGITTMIITLFL